MDKVKINKYVRKSVIGANILKRMNLTHFGSWFERVRDVSASQLEVVMFSFAGNAQEAGAGGRSGAAGIPVRGSLMGRFSL